MGKIVVTEFVSLDGVREDAGGSEDFEHGGWTSRSTAETRVTSSSLERRGATSEQLVAGSLIVSAAALVALGLSDVYPVTLATMLGAVSDTLGNHGLAGRVRGRGG